MDRMLNQPFSNFNNNLGFTIGIKMIIQQEGQPMQLGNAGKDVLPRHVVESTINKFL